MSVLLPEFLGDDCMELAQLAGLPGCTGTAYSPPHEVSKIKFNYYLKWSTLTKYCYAVIRKYLPDIYDNIIY